MSMEEGRRLEGEMDLSPCDREPVRYLETIQPQGYLLALEPKTYRVVRASANCESLLPGPATSLFGRPIAECVGAGTFAHLTEQLAESSPGLVVPLPVAWCVEGHEEQFDGHAQSVEGAILLELEKLDGGPELSANQMRDLVGQGVARLGATKGIDELLQAAVAEIRKLTGFDRAMLYRFDADWSGTVVAEEAAESLEPYLDLRFPASDIPQPARELFALGRPRVIVDSQAEQVPILADASAESHQPLDLAHVRLRGLSPIHAEYLRNMGVGASSSFPLVVEGELWGLLSCHHGTPRRLSMNHQFACEMIIENLVSKLTARHAFAMLEMQRQSASTAQQILASIAEAKSLSEGLTLARPALFKLVEADGVAYYSHDGFQTMGRTPPREILTLLVQWLRVTSKPLVFESRCLSELLGVHPNDVRDACGVLAVALGSSFDNCLLWFRPEVVETVRWGGDPSEKLVSEAGRLHPRESFAEWTETVRGHSAAWSKVHLDAASEFRGNVVDIVASQTAEMARLFGELKDINYMISHDLKAPLRAISSLATWLLEDHADALEESGKELVELIIKRALRMAGMLEGMLRYARLGRSAPNIEAVDTREVVDFVLETLALGPDIQVSLPGQLPEVPYDRTQLEQVFQNLLENAGKHLGKPEGSVRIRCIDRQGHWEFIVEDNGVGIEERHLTRIFLPLQTIKPRDRVESTGIGLSLVARIVDMHGGRVWATSDVGQGSQFHFTVSKDPANQSVDLT
ncbi:Phytochrome-like protein cph1 [Planctomycetes bacterium Pan216]|uniref:histidine kinase n=1 Tax=Kolteria novifilia TaxID=2527975 RepID=A0A518BCJ6_9BACT|nr:Phytochrome-like protein cph1 [Planctomycetes bacterium Pan216]